MQGCDAFENPDVGLADPIYVGLRIESSVHFLQALSLLVRRKIKLTAAARSDISNYRH
jgi:hypothetical protein